MLTCKRNVPNLIENQNHSSCNGDEVDNYCQIGVVAKISVNWSCKKFIFANLSSGLPSKKKIKFFIVTGLHALPIIDTAMHNSGAPSIIIIMKMIWNENTGIQNAAKYSPQWLVLYWKLSALPKWWSNWGEPCAGTSHLCIQNKIENTLLRLSISPALSTVKEHVKWRDCLVSELEWVGFHGMGEWRERAWNDSDKNGINRRGMLLPP